MSIKTRILVVLAFVIAALYSFEVIFTVVNYGFVLPVIVKSVIVVALLYYAFSKIKKSRSSSIEQKNSQP